MILEDLKVVCAELADAGIEFIVIGGVSLVRTYPVGTEDIDVAVTVKDYPGVLAILEKHPRVRYVKDVGTMAGCEFRIGTRGVDVEFINPKLFAGKRPPYEFVDYIRHHRSERNEIAAFADPEVVWYMRLAIPGWETYVQKILRDVRAGVPPELLEKVLDMARYFGMEEKLAPRVEQARRILDLAVRRG